MHELPVLESSHVRLRKLDISDAVSLQRHADDELVRANLFDGFPSPYTIEHAVQWCTEGAHDSKMGYVLGVETGGQIVGCMSILQNSGWLRCNAEIGYWIGREYWGYGKTPEALKLLLEWAQQYLPEVTRIYAPTFAWNQASQRVLQKTGFCLEAHQPRSAIKDGRVVDTVVWAKYR
jgi:[ribosomal protein S5]-alanine N-acetyltransferase